MPSTTVASSSAPHCPQTFAQYGSPLKRPSIIRSLPDAVASDVTSIERMRMASASPTSAPSTATGSVTSCPPLMAGVIIGPQQPGRCWRRCAAVAHGADDLRAGADDAVAEAVDVHGLGGGRDGGTGLDGGH